MATSIRARQSLLRTCVAIVLAHGVAEAQAATKSIVLSDKVSCPTCEIRLRPTVRLGDTDGDGSMPRMANNAIQDSRGRTYVTLYMPPALAYQFDSTGRFVRRIGQMGSGPAEYRSAFLVRGSHDSLAIIDYFNNRRNILAPGGAFVRSTPLPVLSPTAVRLSGGQQLVSSAFGFSIVSNDGVFVTSVGKPTPAQQGSALTSVRASHNNMFWAFGQRPYVLEQWRTDGVKAQILMRSAAFFPSVEKPSSGADGTMPSAVLREVYEDSTGVLWSVVSVASTDWKKWLGPKSPEGGRVPYQKPRLDRLYDSIIETFDTKRGTLIQSVRVPGLFTLFLRDNVVAQHVEDDDGNVYLQLHRIELVRR